MECRKCKHWQRLAISDQFLKEDECGICDGLMGSNVDIELQTGFDGGYVKSIETSANFFCANYASNKGGEK